MSVAADSCPGVPDVGGALSRFLSDRASGLAPANVAAFLEQMLCRRAASKLLSHHEEKVIREVLQALSKRVASALKSCISPGIAHSEGGLTVKIDYHN